MLVIAVLFIWFLSGFLPAIYMWYRDPSYTELTVRELAQMCTVGAFGPVALVCWIYHNVDTDKFWNFTLITKKEKS
jgi:hypothetical protein